MFECFSDFLEGLVALLGLAADHLFEDDGDVLWDVGHLGGVVDLELGDMAMCERTGNLKSGHLMFLHCLPAFHDNNTEVSSEVGAMEVSDEVFEAPFSKVFDEAENRMHTIKAMILASLL